MKTTKQVEEGWQTWLEQRCDSYPQFMHPVVFQKIKNEMRKEVEWFLRTPECHHNLTGRLAKYEMLLENNDEKMTKFDQYWQVRMDFWHWMLE